MISSRLLLRQQQKFRLGPVFPHRRKNAALDFCRIVQAESLMIEHNTYFSIWLHYHQKQRSQKANSALSKNHQTIDSNPPDTLTPEFIQCCQAKLIEMIGPIGKLFVKKTLQDPSCKTPLKFINTLSLSIPDIEKAQCFRDQFIPNLPR